MSELDRRKLLQVLCLSSLALTLDHRFVLADSGSGGGEGGESGGGGEGGESGGGDDGGGDDGGGDDGGGGEGGGGEGGESGGGDDGDDGDDGGESGNSGSGSSNSGSGSGNSGSGSSNSGSGSSSSGSGSSRNRNRNRGNRTGERVRERGNGAEAQRAIRAGKAKPLPEILSAVRERYKGRIIGVEFGQRSGTYVYRLKLVGVSGRVVEINVNARSKRIMSVRNY